MYLHAAVFLIAFKTATSTSSPFFSTNPLSQPSRPRQSQHQAQGTLLWPFGRHNNTHQLPKMSSTSVPATSSASEEDGSKVHLCVLVHGLWGKPSHLTNLATALREAHPEDSLRILVAESNTGNNTYDGVELGAERVATEIEAYIKTVEKDGKTVTKISMLGYSFGGLVARYVVGLFYSSKLFDRIEPVNFTTIATPHLGARTPLVGWHSSMWNWIGARTLSSSGQQLFLVDDFRASGRPLLALMCDPTSIFMRGLQLFKHRSLYANAINDRTVPFYTGYIAKTDPFVDLTTIDMKYEDGYEDVILDEREPAKPKPGTPTFYENLSNGAQNFAGKVPFYLLFTIFAPIGLTLYLGNAGLQSFQSLQRIRDHEEGKSGVAVDTFRIPLLETVQKSADAAFQRANSLQREQYKDEEPKEDAGDDDTETGIEAVKQQAQELQGVDPAVLRAAADAAESEPPGDAYEAKFPTLALAKEQFEMIGALNELGFRKYGVLISKAGHTHAAIVVRMNRSSFSQGRIVSKHWIDRFVL